MATIDLGKCGVCGGVVSVETMQFISGPMMGAVCTHCGRTPANAWDDRSLSMNDDPNDSDHERTPNN